MKPCGRCGTPLPDQTIPCPTCGAEADSPFADLPEAPRETWPVRLAREQNQWRASLLILLCAGFGAGTGAALFSFLRGIPFATALIGGLLGSVGGLVIGTLAGGSIGSRRHPWQIVTPRTLTQPEDPRAVLRGAVLAGLACLFMGAALGASYRSQDAVTVYLSCLGALLGGLPVLVGWRIATR